MDTLSKVSFPIDRSLVGGASGRTRVPSLSRLLHAHWRGDRQLNILPSLHCLCSRDCCSKKRCRLDWWLTRASRRDSPVAAPLCRRRHADRQHWRPSGLAPLPMVRR